MKIQQANISSNPHSEPENNTNFAIEIVAENALLLSWQAEISLTQHNKIMTLETAIKQQLGELVIETLASYHCLMVYFCHQRITSAKVIDKINTIAKLVVDGHDTKNIADSVIKKASTNCIKIPVYYDTDLQWDLAEVATRCNMTINEVINQHSAGRYHGYALGFTPGFCYLASLPESLHLPRKASPRLKVPKGAVAIAEQQSAIYPIESPGGWHIIGQTPLPMFTRSADQFSPTIKVGQNVQFYPISKAEFIAQQQGLQT